MLIRTFKSLNVGETFMPISPKVITVLTKTAEYTTEDNGSPPNCVGEYGLDCIHEDAPVAILTPEEVFVATQSQKYYALGKQVEPYVLYHNHKLYLEAVALKPIQLPARDTDKNPFRT